VHQNASVTGRVLNHVMKKVPHAIVDRAIQAVLVVFVLMVSHYIQFQAFVKKQRSVSKQVEMKLAVIMAHVNNKET
jgi:protein-S-isoprenylcysteine O-methyltransferase Ste14